jgi:hypothetical protein
MKGQVRAFWLNALVITVTVLIWLLVAATAATVILLKDSNSNSQPDIQGYLINECHTGFEYEDSQQSWICPIP